MSSIKMHQEKKELVSQLALSGIPIKEIALKASIPYGSISHYMRMWGIKSITGYGKGLKNLPSSTKYDHLKEQVVKHLKNGERLFDVADLFKIPRGSIGYIVQAWGVQGLQEKSRGKRFTDEGEKLAREKVSQSHKRGRKHHFEGLHNLNGGWVTEEKFLEEVKRCMEEDLTYEQARVKLGLKSPTAIWKIMKKYNLLSGLRTGDRCYLWRGGHRKYRGPDWKEQRDKRLRFDNYTCVDCGKTNLDEEHELKHKLSVHHIVPYEVSQDNSLENLVTLCQSCHMKHEHKDGRFRITVK